MSTIDWYGEFAVRTVTRDDRRGEKLGSTTTYDILHFTTVISTCNSAEQAREIAMALDEKARLLND